MLRPHRLPIAFSQAGQPFPRQYLDRRQSVEQRPVVEVAHATQDRDRTRGGSHIINQTHMGASISRSVPPIPELNAATVAGAQGTET